MLFFVLVSALICSVLPMPGLSEKLQAEGAFPGISLDISTSPEPNISGLNTSLSIRNSSSAPVESTNKNETTEFETEQNFSTSAEENGVSLNISITTTLNYSTPRLANTPSEDSEIATSSAIYYFEVLVISLSTITVVVIAVHLTRQLRLSGFRRRFRSSGRGGTIGKRYSDISLQLLSRESGILDLPNISEERESQVVAGKAEVVHYFLKESDSPMRSPPLTPTTENGSLKSADGVWL